MIDYFIIKYNNSSLLSTSSITNIIHLLDKLHIHNEKFATSHAATAAVPTTLSNKKLMKNIGRKQSVNSGGDQQNSNDIINSEKLSNGTLNRRLSLVKFHKLNFFIS